MASFNNLQELEKYLKDKINDTLNKEVAQVVKENIAQTVQTEVYNAGDPVRYIRREIEEGTGSLGDITQMNHAIKNGVLEVTDDAKPKKPFPNLLAENIEYGYAGKGAWWNKERPFMAKAKENLQSNKDHINAMKIGLEKRGLDVK